MSSFLALGLPESLLQSLTAMKFESPTPIQEQTIPSALEGRDILGTAQTGTGKTAAFGIPLVSYLLQNPQSTALVLTPTRELALQVLSALQQLLGRKSGIESVLLIGGESMDKQLKILRLRPRLVVGTPGRINDHLNRKSLQLNRCNFLVLDEMDRMLDMGFVVQLKKIEEYLPQERQTLMFSATISKEVAKIADSFLNDALRVSVGSTTRPTEKIKQEIIQTSESEKYPALLEQLNNQHGSVIIFVKTKHGTEKLAKKLAQEGYLTEAIHGDLRQRSRDRVIREFRSKKINILVATDVAARGLDIPHLECVINHDLPQCPEDYIHRIGRTGRAGAEGTAISLITKQDNGKWRDICRLMNPDSVPDRGFSRRSSEETGPSRQSRRTRPSSPSSFSPRKGVDRFNSSKNEYPQSLRREKPKFAPRTPGSFQENSGSYEDRPPRDNNFSNGRAARPERSEFSPFQKKRRPDDQGTASRNPAFDKDSFKKSAFEGKISPKKSFSDRPWSPSKKSGLGGEETFGARSFSSPKKQNPLSKGRPTGDRNRSWEKSKPLSEAKSFYGPKTNKAKTQRH